MVKRRSRRPAVVRHGRAPLFPQEVWQWLRRGLRNECMLAESGWKLTPSTALREGRLPIVVRASPELPAPVRNPTPDAYPKR